MAVTFDRLPNSDPARPGDPLVTTDEPITIDVAQAMDDLFTAAAKDSPIRQIRREMQARAREWRRALSHLEECAGEGVIEHVGSCARYTVIYWAGEEGESWWTVIKATQNGSLMVENPMVRGPRYYGYHDEASPVVVKR